MSYMKKMQDQRGSMNMLLVPVILLAVLFVSAAVFAVWAFSSRQDYKNNSDAKSAAAVAVNKQVVQAADAAQFAEAAKKPLKAYIGPETYGSLRIMYPKTWSSYVDTGNASSKPLDAYFHTDYVPSVGMKQTYNLRIRVVATSYNTVLNQYTSDVKLGKVTATPYTLPKVPDVAGMRLDGQIVSDQPTTTGEMILLPVRDKTLEIWTESTAYLPDFTNNILPNMTFSP
jgi:hypothetical protein